MGSAHTKQVEWHSHILPSATRRALDFLSEQRWLKQSPWYLAGGTALGLQVGHRRSLDLDFFNPKGDFSIALLIKHFSKKIWEADIVREGTVYGRLLGAKVSFIAYPFFRAKEPYSWYGNVRIVAPRDIAVMKIIAISQRGKKRDFVDLYWYLHHRETLSEILSHLPAQYPTITHDYHHILKSLMYFVDADGDNMPTLYFKTNWRTIKSYFQREVPKVAKELLFRA